ncbi:MAG: hypothetical protein LKJ90_07825 [Faecalibacterium sp.]|jgi:hypothetical protein|nr:hypothetical protein [Faecalibacterium sp.]
MKRILKAALVALLLAGLTVFAVHTWVHAGANAESAVCVYAPSAAPALDYESVVQTLDEAGIAATLDPNEDDVLAAAKRHLDAGATVLVIGLDQAPEDDSLLQAANAKNANLFFVGAYPGDDYLNSYDKAYYIGSHAEYGGELAGKAAAMIYRNGVIADQTGNALLDYLSTPLNADAEKTLLRYTLAECEHYGVYSESSLTPHAAADSSASSEAGTSLETELGLHTGTAESAAFTPDYSSLSEGAAALQAAWVDLEYEPEILYCFGAPALQSAEEYAQCSGWMDRACPVQFICFTQSLVEAQQADDGTCGTIVYYDVDAASAAVSHMILNVIQQNYIAESTGLSLDENDALWVPYQLYSSAENNTPAAVPDTDSSAASASASAAQS